MLKNNSKFMILEPDGMKSQQTSLSKCVGASESVAECVGIWKFVEECDKDERAC